MSFTNISAALDNHLKDAVGMPSVAWPNMAFKPVNGEAYLRPTLLPADTIPQTVGTDGKDFNAGIYQIDIFTKSGKGKKESQDIADLLGDRFSHGTQMTYGGLTVEVKTTSIRAASNNDDGWYHVMVEIVYYSFTARR